MPTLWSAQKAENWMTVGILGRCKGFTLQLPFLHRLLCKAMGIYFEKNISSVRKAYEPTYAGGVTI